MHLCGDYQEFSAHFLGQRTRSHRLPWCRARRHVFCSLSRMGTSQEHLDWVLCSDGTLFGIGAIAGEKGSPHRLKMRLSPDLQAELKALPDTPLHPQVDTILQRATSERAELQRVLNDSLKDDVAIDGLGILREYDAGFADLLDRAHPLTTLLKQAQSGSTAAQDQSEDGLKVLRSVSDGIHNLAVSVLGYAGSRNSQALDDLKHRTEDLRAARKSP